jgi:hypothetical protein
LLAESQLRSFGTLRRNRPARVARRDHAAHGVQFALEEIDVDQRSPQGRTHVAIANGKLSALRWVLGEDWDMLDT